MAYEYGCFGYGMMSGGYGYGWMIFSWLIGLLLTAGFVVFILCIIKKMRYEDVPEKNNTRRGK
jgi:uncharacterized membrane protein